VVYTPLFPLSLGSFIHAKNGLFYPIRSIASTPGIIFDSCLDAGFYFMIFAHLLMARFRPLPRPKVPLRDGLLPKLQLHSPKKLTTTQSSASSAPDNQSSSSSSTTTNSTSSDNALLALSQSQGWEKCYQWRSGLTYYENMTSGDLLYDEGGPGAIYEETDVDLFQVGKTGVFIGPSFKVILDRSDEFVDIWGQSFHKKKSAPLEQHELEGVIEAALANEYCWVIALGYALIVFLATLGTSKAYHSLAAMALAAVLVVYLHMKEQLYSTFY
jgi:hypothetical protein